METTNLGSSQGVWVIFLGFKFRMTCLEAWTFLLLQMLIGSGLNRVIACKENMDSNNQTRT